MRFVNLENFGGYFFELFSGLLASKITNPIGCPFFNLRARRAPIAFRFYKFAELGLALCRFKPSGTHYTERLQSIPDGNEQNKRRYFCLRN
jgi:hypothetical protein